MENSEASNQLLKNKYDLHKTPEVAAAAARHQGRTGESVSQDPLDRIGNYLNRFHEITDREDPEARKHGIDAIKRLIHRKYVIKPDEIPEAYWDTQRRIIRERGQGDELDFVDWEEVKRQNTEAIIADQNSSLDKWIDYLATSDAPYSDSLKYYTLRSVLNMGVYDKEKKAYPQRSKGTTKPFPDLNREALAYVLDAVEKKYTSTGAKRAQEDTDPEFEKLLQGENFGKLYAWAIEKVTPADAEGLANTQGQWVRYNQGSDHMPLVQSLQGHGTGWCTAGESTARTQLEDGDFYVYYSNDREGKPTIPRVAIRMEGASIGEVRGIAPEQNMDAYIAPIVEQKLEEFPDGKAYQKKVADMKQLTAIEHSTKAGTPLDASDLTFLYEIDSPIQGFGYYRDPRIEELRSQRNPDEDMLVVFSLEASQIAHAPGEINPDTKAYVGPLVTGIFSRLDEHHIEHIYTSFPEGKIQRQEVEIGGKNKQQLRQELSHAGIKISSFAGDIMRSPHFTTRPNVEHIDTVRIKAQSLGLTGKEETGEIYARARNLDLDLCPAEVGPHLRIAYKDQPKDESIVIAMVQISGSSGDLGVFELTNDVDGSWLNGIFAELDAEWLPETEFVFCVSKESLNY